MIKTERLIMGDCKEKLKELAGESVDAIVTDPPYAMISGEYGKDKARGGFMNKSWDAELPSVEIWKECLRVLKPGAFLLAMSAPRADLQSHMILRIQEAGFSVRFSPIYWAFASGFPKAMNISKAIDKRLGQDRGDAKRQAKFFDGAYGGFQPKPAVEVIIVAMKPLSEKTYVDQALKNGKGITWLANCRIPYQSEADSAEAEAKQSKNPTGVGSSFGKQGIATFCPSGRFPANLLVSDDVLNDGKISKSGWRDEDDEPVKGDLLNGIGGGKHYNDCGSFSRYFSLNSWMAKKLKELPESVQKTFPFIICPKANKEEKNANLDWRMERPAGVGGKKGMNNSKNRTNGTERKEVNHINSHPTCKPLNLMMYLVTLASREGDTVLDPFAGSFTTGVACKILRRNFIGIEQNEEYFAIGKARLAGLPPQLF